MDLDQFTLEPFVTDEPAGRRPQRSRRSQNTRRRGRRSGNAALIQAVICVAALLLLLGLELFVFHDLEEPRPASAAPASTDAEETEENAGRSEEETLGRLKFVNGRFYSVYPADARWSLPLTASEMESLNEGSLLKLTADPGENVCAAAAGQVRSVGIDEQYGKYVRIGHGGDLESVYYHLDAVCVEEGQPLQTNDTLGTVGSDGELYVAVLEGGQPQRALNFYEAPAGS